MPADTFHVTLRAADGFDEFHERKLTMHPGERIIIGRASRNLQKPELMTAPNNAFIDSPVISRAHAALTVQPTPPAVYIADNGSMHGTLVNGDRLEAHRALKLESGDLLQFGADVTRDTDHFVARKYTFQAILPEASFAHGFTVPDSETSEAEDDIDDATSSPPPAHLCYGSQANPVTIQDSEDLPPQVAAEKEITTVRSEPTAKDEMQSNEPRTLTDDTAELYAPSSPLLNTASVMADTHSVYSSAEEDEESMWPLVDEQDSLMDHDPILDGDYISDYGSSDNEHEDAASDSHSDVERSSDVSSDEEESEDEEDNMVVEDNAKDEDADAVRRMKLKTMISHQEEMSPPQPELTPMSSQANAKILDSLMVHDARPEPNNVIPKAPEPSLSAYESNFTNSFGTWGSPLPPRSEPLKWMPWGASAEYVSPYTPRESSSRTFTGDVPIGNPFVPHSTFQDAWYSPMNVEPFEFKFSQPPQAVMNTAQHPEVSPPIQSLGSAKVAVPSGSPQSADSSPSQPIRRTKVSITEIVEDVPEQPPNPTSVSRSLKRKAEVLDEEIEELVEEVVDSTTTQHSAQAAPVTVATDIDTSPTSERPKKRLRAALGGAAKTVAGLLIPGTILAVSVLTQLPDGFWAT
ncbi:hypothetical protein CC80DRAFT_542747 [Byssothecium circinans]|uniref:FHA domain-containing protein n=1 Tax=Byssothecium circinans TaxID=147558 RepID=A0A6A5UES7_9PLEO|nr:hypothetical protein CC80DRAFT_542747 [Byssothecium circinans]